MKLIIFLIEICNNFCLFLLILIKKINNYEFMEYFNNQLFLHL